MPAMDYEKIARLYDIPFFLEQAKSRTGNVLELMCGTGRVSLPLIEAGVTWTGVDSSVAMLEILQKKLNRLGSRAKSIRMDVCDLDLDSSFDLIFIPFHSFAEIVDKEKQKQTLIKIRDHLTNDGMFICTLRNPSVRLRTVDGQKRCTGTFEYIPDESTLTLWSQEHYIEDKNLVEGVQSIENHDKEGNLISQIDLDIRFIVHKRKPFEALARETGFRVKTLYGSYEKDAFDEEKSPVMIFMLEKV